MISSSGASRPYRAGIFAAGGYQVLPLEPPRGVEEIVDLAALGRPLRRLLHAPLPLCPSRSSTIRLAPPSHGDALDVLGLEVPRGAGGRGRRWRYARDRRGPRRSPGRAATVLGHRRVRRRLVAPAFPPRAPEARWWLRPPSSVRVTRNVGLGQVAWYAGGVLGEKGLGPQGSATSGRRALAST